MTTGRTTYDAIAIQYDRRTDQRDIYPGTRRTRLRQDEVTIIGELVGWAPYTHHVTIEGEYGDPDHYHAIIPEPDTIHARTAAARELNRLTGK